MNSFGNIFRLTTFGESHGPAIGGVLDGMPAGVPVDRALLDTCMSRRRPGNGPGATCRHEADKVKVLSGVFEGLTTGAPVGFVIENADAEPGAYDRLRGVNRPSHADYTTTCKYGLRDHRGGGRSSARETAVRVAAGAFAEMALRPTGITVTAYVDSIGGVTLPADYPAPRNAESVYASPVRCPDHSVAEEMVRVIAEARSQGDTLGGVVKCVIRGMVPGLGDPVGGKLHAQLGAAMLSINAVKGFDYGMGFAGAALRGSEVADMFGTDGSRGVHALTNRSGGIQGGISNGEDIYFRVAFKPVPTMMRPVRTVDDAGLAVTLNPGGRHDICVVPRAVAVVEAMAKIVLLDAWLSNQTVRMR